MTTSSPNQLKLLVKPAFFFALCCATRLASADVERVLFEPHASDTGPSAFADFFGAQTVPPGTGKVQKLLASLSLPETDNVQRSIDQHLLGIEAIGLRQGPYAEALGEPLLALGRLYQQEQQHDKALEILERARHITRVNHGLNSPEQFPAIELSIQSYLAMQDYQQAHDQQQLLVQLYKSHYGSNSPEIVPQLVALADMYFDAFERWRHEVPGGSAMAPERGPDTAFLDPNEMRPIDLAFLCLHQAHRNYLQSISILLQQEKTPLAQLAQLERQVITTLFLQAHKSEMEVERVYFMGEKYKLRKRGQIGTRGFDEKYDYYHSGELSFARMLEYLEQNPSLPPTATAEVMLQFGDWHRLFGHIGRSEQAYAEAINYLRANETDEATIASVLSPAVPVQLPAFLPAPYSLADSKYFGRDVTTEGYVELGFVIGKNGRASDFEVVASSPNASKAVETRLLKVLKNAPFRPQLADGSAGESAPVTVRYQFAHY